MLVLLFSIRNLEHQASQESPKTTKKDLVTIQESLQEAVKTNHLFDPVFTRKWPLGKIAPNAPNLSWKSSRKVLNLKGIIRLLRTLQGP